MRPCCIYILSNQWKILRHPGALAASISYQMFQILESAKILLGLWKSRHSNLPSALWNELSWTKRLCLSHVWPLGSNTHLSDSGSRVTAVSYLFSFPGGGKTSAKYLCCLLKGFGWWSTGLCTERTNQMKPSALGLILSVTVGFYPGQTDRTSCRTIQPTHSVGTEQADS